MSDISQTLNTILIVGAVGGASFVAYEIYKLAKSVDDKVTNAYNTAADAVEKGTTIIKEAGNSVAESAETTWDMLWSDPKDNNPEGLIKDEPPPLAMRDPRSVEKTTTMSEPVRENYEVL